LTSVNGQAYTWDNNGNLTNDGSKTYLYNQANQLTGITATGLTWSASYNGDDARLRQLVNGVPTTYTLDLAAPLVTALAERTGATTKQYLYGQGDSPMAVYSGTTWTYLSGRDGLNSVRQETDASGNVLTARSFDPYGVPLDGNGGSPFGYTGEQTDATGLVFLRARYMQPALGMFLSHDPWEGNVQRPESLNGWNYVEGNPVNHIDPSGLQGPSAIAINCQGAQLPLCLSLIAEAGPAITVIGPIIGPTVLVIAVVGIITYSLYGVPRDVVADRIPVPIPAPAPPRQLPRVPSPEEWACNGGCARSEPIPGPQPLPAPTPTPQPKPDPRWLDPGPIAPPTCTPTPKSTIWRAISSDPNRSAFNWNPDRLDWDGLSGTRGGAVPYHIDPVAWFTASFRRNPNPGSDRIVATTEQDLTGAGYSVVNTPRLDVDPWHVSIGGTVPGIIEREGRPSWPGNKPERKAIANLLASLFTMQVWP
jgi:RHS repeat-associated protein